MSKIMADNHKFELEQAIMNCWHVVDDIKTVSNNVGRLSQDDLLNALIGMSTLYQMKFEDLFAQFEKFTSAASNE
jgi:hypothetical protein